MRENSSISMETVSGSLKASSYNAFVQLEDGNYYGYNFLYDSLIQLSESTYPKVADLLGSDDNSVSLESLVGVLGKETVNALQKSRFLIDKNTSELSIVKYHYNSQLYCDSRARLIVLPTLSCNFDCPYCFEYKKPIHMNREMEDHLMKFVETHFAGKRRIELAWFGGEPLLSFKSILRVSERMKSFCDSINAELHSGLTTNGYLLNQDFIDNLSNTNIKFIQVTFDGDQEHHDVMRKTKSGQGSFQQILENVIRFCETVPENACNLTIRVNCSDDNYDSIDNLLYRFPLFVRQRCTIFFRTIESNEASAERGYTSFSREMYEKGSFSLIGVLTKKAKEAGWKTFDPYIVRKFSYCEVDLKDQYTVYPNGDVFLCNHDDTPNMRLFNISSQSNLDNQHSSHATHAKWISLDPFSDKKCVGCKILPYCLGGCRLARYKGTQSSCIVDSKADQFILRNRILAKLDGLPTGRPSYAESI